MSNSIKITIGFIVSVLIIIIFFTYQKYQDNHFIGYVNFNEAKNRTKTVQVYGFYINEKGKSTDCNASDGIGQIKSLNL